jgi:glutathionylspermidine synthase
MQNATAILKNELKQCIFASSNIQFYLLIQHQSIVQLPNAVFADLGWEYFISPEAADYLTSEVVVISEAEREAYYAAGNRLYDLFVEAGERILQRKLLAELGIPSNLHELVRLSWERDHLHLFGRFDLAGGTSGLPLKLLEFNADTPTSLPETAIIQWAQLRANELDEERQFNFVLEALTEQFRRLREQHPTSEAAMLFSALRGAPEDDNNVSVLMEAAREAGFEADFRYIDEVVFSEEEGIFTADELGRNYRQFPFWFKLVPWEYIANDEPELCRILTRIVQRHQAIVLNPAYTMIFQSKAILKYLWDYFPDEPLLLETSFDEPIGRRDYPFVQKVIFGREGSDVAVYDELGRPVEVREGEYAGQKSVFQAFATLDRDVRGQYYQAGVFFSYEACGLGFRRGTRRILDNAAQFAGHIISD